MPSKPDRQLEETIRGVGPSGPRAADLLVRASELSKEDSPRTGDLVAFCCREALTGLLQLEDEPRPLLRQLIKEVIAAARPTLEVESEDLLKAIRRLEEESRAYEGIHVRRMEEIVRRYARAEPRRFQADLFDLLRDLMHDLNEGVHSGLTLERAESLYEKTLDVIRRLFTQMSSRLDILDELAKKEYPVAEDLGELVKWSFDPRHLDYFFRECNSLAWLRLLWNHKVLEPSDEGHWPAFRFLSALADETPGQVIEWLQARPINQETGDGTVLAYLWLAEKLGVPASGVVAEILRRKGKSPRVFESGLRFLEDVEPGDDGQPLIEVLDVLLNAVPEGHQWHSQSALIRISQRMCQTDLGREYLRILVFKLNREARSHKHRITITEPLNELVESPHHLSVAELLLIALVVGLKNAEKNLSLEERIAVLDELSPEARSRVLAKHLSDTAPVSHKVLVEFLADELSLREPTVESAALLHDLEQKADSRVMEGLVKALGSPPSVEEVIRLSSHDDWPDDLLRNHAWLAVISDENKKSWSEVDAIITAKIGAAPPDAHLIGPTETHWGPDTPFSVEEINQRNPLESAQRIAAWRSDGSWLGPSARGLERSLKEAVSQVPAAWAQQPVEIVARLRHPTYIRGYFEGLREAPPEALAGPALTRAISLAWSEPWAVIPLGRDNDFDFDPDWSSAKNAGIELLAALWDKDISFEDQEADAWRLVLKAARDRDDSTSVSGDEIDPLTEAINRYSTRALTGAFSYAAFLARNDRPIDDQFLDLIDEALSLCGKDGEQSRAVIAPRLPFLWKRASEWFTSRKDVLIGNKAPDGLGAITFDLYLKWGRPFGEFIGAMSNEYTDAMNAGKRRAVDHVLLALLWDVRPWNQLHFTLGVLGGAPPSAMSEAGEFIGRLISEQSSDERVRASAMSFWRAALEAESVPASYEGFGWLPEYFELETEEWLELTERTIARAEGKVKWAGNIAEKAAGHPHDVRAINILASLLAGENDIWEVSHIAQAGMTGLAESRGRAPESNRSVLRERLLERGYYEAKDL